MNNPEKIKQILLSEIEKMNQHREVFCKRPGIDFTRDSKIPFTSLLHFQISMESGSVNHELLKYFNFRVGTPSLPAFCQQRAKLSDDVFQKLFYNFNNCFKPKALLKGRYQLLACDGSGFTFTKNPRDTESYYNPDGRSEKGDNQMYLVPLYDLLNKVYTDAVIQPMRKRNEFTALYELIDRHSPCSGTVPVFIADRGFHAYNVFAHAIENSAFFVIRATDTKTKRLPGADLPKEEAFDIWVTRYLTRSHSKKKYLHPESADQYRHICSKVAFDYFPAQGYGEYEISLRVLRLPIGNGTYENIITNLPENEFHEKEIREIYCLRWGIETSFCTLKHVIAAANFHSKSRQMITHEIWAGLILFNFCSYITGQVTFEKQKRKHIHQVNFSIAFKTCRHFLRLHSGEEPPDVEGLIRKHTLPVRPDRNFGRQPGTCQLYIPILTDSIIIPHSRHFSYLLICHAIKQKLCSINGMTQAICFNVHSRITPCFYNSGYLFNFQSA